MDSPYLSSIEAAKYLNLSVRTLYNKISMKEFQRGIHFYKPKRKLQFIPDALENYIKSSAIESIQIDRNFRVIDDEKAETDKIEIKSRFNV